MKPSLKCLIFCFVFSLFLTGQCLAVTEEDVKNFTYTLTFSGQTVTLQDGKYERPASDYLKVWIEKFVLVDFTGNVGTPEDAVVILGQNGGGSEVIYELTTLIQTKDKGLQQTSSIVLGDRVFSQFCLYLPTLQ